MDMVQWKKGLSNSPSDFDYMQFQNVDPIVYVVSHICLDGWNKSRWFINPKQNFILKSSPHKNFPDFHM